MLTLNCDVFRNNKFELPIGSVLEIKEDSLGNMGALYFNNKCINFLPKKHSKAKGVVRVVGVRYKDYDSHLREETDQYFKGQCISSIDIELDQGGIETDPKDDKKSFNEDVVINFNEVNHTYTYKGQELKGGTTFIKKYLVEFDTEGVSEICEGHWGIPQDKIVAAWELNRDFASQFGTAIHKAIEFEQLYSGYKKKKGERCFRIKHPMINGFVKDFFEIYDKLGFEGESVPEALISDVKNGSCGLVDNLLVTSWEKKTCRIQDYKVNHSVEKLGTVTFKDLPEGLSLPTNKLSKFSLQLKRYAEILEDSGWTVEGFDVFVLDDVWKYYKVSMLRGFRLSD